MLSNETFKAHSLLLKKLLIKGQDEVSFQLLENSDQRQFLSSMFVLKLDEISFNIYNLHISYFR